MEQGLTGKQVFDEIVKDNTTLSEIVDIGCDVDNETTDQNEALRHSRIVNCPNKRKVAQKHESVLTAFIKLQNDDGKP